MAILWTFKSIPSYEMYFEGEGIFASGDYDESYPSEYPLKHYICRFCGGTKFYVGTGSYWTAIKCINCKWEACVHDG